MQPYLIHHNIYAKADLGKEITVTIYPKYLFARLTGRRGGRRGVIFCHILPYQNVSFCYDKLVKLIGITSENPDGAKRTRTADPLHAMQVLYQLSYGPIVLR